MEPVRVNVINFMDLAGAEAGVYAGIDINSSNNFMGLLMKRIDIHDGLGQPMAQGYLA
jgi:hypothetical protein